jgi:chitinase
VYTITSCAPTVTNCPAGHVTTETIVIGTTVCPVVDVTATVVPVTTPPASSGEWTTSTVYSTTVYTITSCAASVTNCPAKGSVTTEVIPLYTTVCPVTATEGSGVPSKPTGGAGAGASSGAGSGSGAGSESLPQPTGGIKEQGSTTTTKVTSVSYTFVTIPSKGPSAGVPGPSAGVPAPSGNGTSLVITYTVKPTGATLPTGSAAASSTQAVTAGAGRNGVALGLSGLIAAAVMLL